MGKYIVCQLSGLSSKATMEKRTSETVMTILVPFLLLTLASLLDGKNIQTTTDGEVRCQNGGSWLSGSQVQGCVCPGKYYGKFCEKKMCRQYVKLKSPATALYKSLSSIEGGHTRYRLTYRTRYSNVVKCFEDL